MASNLRLLWQNLFSSRVDETQHIIDQVFVTLDSGYCKAVKKNKDENFVEICNRIETRLKDEKNWRNAYHIELLMVGLLNEDQLDVELSRRMVDARSYLKPEVSQAYDERYKTADTVEKKRALLERIVKDIQWHHEVRQAHRIFSSVIRVRTDVVFMMSFLLFLTPVAMPDSFYKEMFENPRQSHYIITVVSAGWMGSAFSMLLNLKDRLEKSKLHELRIMFKYSYLFSRVIIGMGSGLILYYFFHSGMMEASFFPNMNELSPDNLAKLVIWCILAGFSERLVPNILSQTESQVKTLSK